MSAAATTRGALLRRNPILHHLSTRSAFASSEILMRSVQEDCRKTLTAVSFKQMYQHTQFTERNVNSNLSDSQQIMMQSAEFTRKEERLRMAQLIVSLTNLPYGVADTDSLRGVLCDYLSSYEELQSLAPIRSMSEVHAYCALGKRLLLKHLLVIAKMSYVLLQKEVGACPHLNDFIDAFAAQRMQSRVLIGHFLAMHEQLSRGALRGELRHHPTRRERHPRRDGRLRGALRGARAAQSAHL